MGEMIESRLRRLLEPREHASTFMEEQSAIGVEAGLEYLDRGRGEPTAVLAAVAKLEAERDQLDQQVETLLSAVEEHRIDQIVQCNKCGYVGRNEIHDSATGCTYAAVPSLRDQGLYAAADQVRKERGT